MNLARAALCLALLLAQEKAAASKPLDIRPAEKGWGVDGEVPKRVLDAAASELWKFFPDRELKPILVEPTGGPITLFARGPKGEFQVKLATGDTYWAQYTFQFAHEFCHILCGYDEDPHRHKWLEETFCEIASLFVLRRSAETWKTKPPYAHWKDYAKSLAAYADERIKASPLPAGKTLADWRRDHADALAKNATDRAKNNVAAVQLLPLFEKEPEQWASVAWLNTEKLDEATTFEQYLSAWHKNCPEKHRGFVKKIAKALAIEIRR